MIRIISLICILGSTVLMAGCWNSRDIQSLAYVTAIGLDYRDGKFVTYAQVLNFSNVAKGESEKVGQVVPNWIGKGEGDTLIESFFNIYKTSQIRVFWGHVKAIICTEAFLNHEESVKGAYDALNRYREIRYNVLLYGTKEQLQDIFAEKSLFNLSPLDTVVYSPARLYAQSSFIQPIYGYKIIAKMNEPTRSAMIPSITLDKGSWHEDNNVKPMLKIDGAYILTHDKVNWMPEKDLMGARWLQRKMSRSPINIPDGPNTVGAMVLIDPKVKIKPIMEGSLVKYDITLSFNGYVEELVKDMPEKMLEDKAAKVIGGQIRNTYNKGLEQQIDVLFLDETLYREYPRKWHEMHEKPEEFVLKKDSLNKIDVTVHLIHTGKYKGRTE